MNNANLISLTRRAVSGLLAGALVAMSAAQAAPPAEQTQVPGFYRQQVGSTVVTAIYDGYVALDPKPDGKAAFPNATVWAARKDAEFWLNAASAPQLPADQHSFLKMAQDAVAPYAAKGRFKTFGDGDAIVAGISVVPSNGHTPGHSSYLVASGAEKMLVWGDIVHFHAVQLPHPEVTIEVDVQPKAAIASRQRILADSARNGWLVAAAHHPFPGIGHVRSEGKGYAWVPVEYGDLPPAQK